MESPAARVASLMRPNFQLRCLRTRRSFEPHHGEVGLNSTPRLNSRGTGVWATVDESPPCPALLQPTPPHFTHATLPRPFPPCPAQLDPPLLPCGCTTDPPRPTLLCPIPPLPTPPHPALPTPGLAHNFFGPFNKRLRCKMICVSQGYFSI